MDYTLIILAGGQGAVGGADKDYWSWTASR